MTKSNGLRSFLHFSLLLLWVAVWVLGFWMESGPCAWVMALQMKIRGAVYPKEAQGISLMFAIMPVYGIFLKAPAAIGAPLVWLLRLSGVVCGVFCVCSLWTLLTLKEAPKFHKFSELESFAGFRDREMIYDGLAEEFNLHSGAIFTVRSPNESSKALQYQSSFYVPQRSNSTHHGSVDAVLILSKEERERILGIAGERRKNDSRPDEFLEEMSLTGGTKWDSNALGNRWTIARKPLPYVVRKTLKIDEGAKFPLQVYPGTGERDYLLTVAGVMLGWTVFSFLAIIEVKKWC